MKKSKRMLVSVLILSMLISLIPSNNTAIQAAKKPKLSKTKETITVGKTKIVKVKNSVKKAKVLWKTSNKKVAKITKKVTKGKKAKAYIKGVKAGKATISAKYTLGKKVKNLKCKVTVKDKKEELVNTASPTSYIVVTDAPIVSEAPVTEEPAAGTPTVKPTREPTPPPTPTPSPLPVGDYNFPAVSGGIALDLSTYESLSGNGRWDAANQRLTINDGSPSDLTQGTWSLPSTIPAIKEGDIVKFRIQGYSYGNSGFRLWIGSGMQGGCTPVQLVNSVNPDNAIGEYPEVVDGTLKNQMAFNANSQHAFDVTVTFKAGTSQNDTNGSYPNLTLKYIMDENEKGYIDGVVIKNMYYLKESDVPSTEMQKILDSISIPDAEAVRGSITLPEEVDGATITWVSSDANVITDTVKDGKAAGVVTRGTKDQKITLTATVKKGNEMATKTIIVNVLKAPAAITEDDYAGYLFGHFISESDADGEQIYFATSSNRLNFTDMNCGQPVLRSTVGEEGVRDPYLYRSPEGDRFFLIATDLSIYHRGGWKKNEQGYYDPSTTGSHYLVLWESTDLVNWGTPKHIKVAPENAGMAWAPEMIYDDVSGQYIIFFASSIMNPETKYKAKPNAIYYVATRDFVNFSDTKLLIDNQTDGEEEGKAREIIDTTILKIGDTYYSASKDGDNAEKNGGIRIMKTKSLLDPASWEKVYDLDELGLDLSGQKISALTNATLEGPELFQLNKKDWADPEKPEYVLMADQYAAGAGYLPITTTDLEDTTGASWKLLSSGSDYSFDLLKKRHGTVLKLTQAELDRVNAAFPNTEEYLEKKEMQIALNSITIPNSNNIRGNITLPEEVNGVGITWESSNENVITAAAADGKAAGVVTRGTSDQRVTLTAKAVKGTIEVTRSIRVRVLKAPAAITEDDYAGYLFGHFISESDADGEQIYFATSSNRLNFTDMNCGQPVLRSTVGEEGVRDPYLYRSPEGDRFFLIATDLSIYHRGGWKKNEQGYYDPSTTGSHYLVLWESTDLVNWGTPKHIKVAPENAGMAWAPEMIYDDVSGQYIIFFASSIMNPETKYKAKPNAIYYVATRDFVNFSDTKLLIDNQTDGEEEGKAREIIDTTILKIGDTYYSASKDGDNAEKNGGIRIMKTKSLLDPASWEKVYDLDELGLDLSGQKISALTNATLEGPELFQLNKKDWADPEKPEYVLMADQYAAGAGYLPITTTDLEDTTGASWKLLSSGSDYSFDLLKKRHGTVLKLTQAELDRVNAAFPNTEEYLEKKEVQIVANSLLIPNAMSLTEDFVVPTEKDGINIAWTSSNAAISFVEEAGVLKGKVTQGSTASSFITITATLTKGDIVITRKMFARVAALSTDTSQ